MPTATIRFQLNTVASIRYSVEYLELVFSAALPSADIKLYSLVTVIYTANLTDQLQYYKILWAKLNMPGSNDGDI